MPKNSRRKEAALRRERDKRGEIDPKEAGELAQDGNYIPEDVLVNLDAPPANSDPDLTPSQLGERIRNLARAAAALLPTKVIRNTNADLMPNVETNATSRKQRTENNDLIDHPPPGQSTSTLYRERNGKTQKARAKTMQPNHFCGCPRGPVEEPSEMAAVSVEESPSETETGLTAIDVADEPATEPVPDNPAPARLEPRACEVEMTCSNIEPPTVAVAGQRDQPQSSTHGSCWSAVRVKSSACKAGTPD
ncbi:hypothetical protein B0H14DRAFT_3563298 [Mycena olivaceomarginata]|nr:hypothetical protein B0H14DRAFT_3563298 [Mycena olivaceomarginata]